MHWVAVHEAGRAGGRRPHGRRHHGRGRSSRDPWAPVRGPSRGPVVHDRFRCDPYNVRLHRIRARGGQGCAGGAVREQPGPRRPREGGQALLHQRWSSIATSTRRLAQAAPPWTPSPPGRNTSGRVFVPVASSGRYCPGPAESFANMTSRS